MFVGMNRKKIVVSLEIRMFLRHGSMGASYYYFFFSLSFREKHMVEQQKN